MTRGPSFSHLLALTDRYGTYEHADHTAPRRDHGFCTDDVARVLLVCAREPRPTPAISGLARTSLRFLADAQGAGGATRNRRTARGRWRGRRGVEDCWGRSMLAFGVTAAHDQRWLAEPALAYFEHGCGRRSPWPRAMSFAALGAAAVLAVDPTHRRARDLLADCADVVGSPTGDPAWPWPEPRLAYANAVIPEALVAAGVALDRPGVVDDGLGLLGWLLARETRHGHLSLTPAGGAGPDDHAPRFDQQPIEAATLAEACTRAGLATGDPRWAEGVRMAGAWFDGDNDLGIPMWDRSTGGAYDGLHPDRANQNQGAESTLALIATRQQVRRLEAVGS